MLDTMRGLTIRPEIEDDQPVAGIVRPPAAFPSLGSLPPFGQWIAALPSAPQASGRFAAAEAPSGMLTIAGDESAQASFAYAMSLMAHGPLARFDTQLAALYMQTTTSIADDTSAFTDMVQQFSGALVNSAKGKTYVVVDVVARDGDGGALLEKLEAIGLKGGASFGGMASGYLPVDALDALAHMKGLAFARESGMMSSVGSVTTQAVRAQEADVAVSTFGVDGHGIKVGVLSDSFDTSGNPIDMATDIAMGDLPAGTKIFKDSAGGTDEGRGMAQLVYDVAPGSNIGFHTANGGQAAFANGILKLASKGHQVIVDDVAYFAELSYQDGVIAQAIDQVVANGSVYFSSAGNSANHGLEQVWSTGATINVGGRGTEKLMRFAPGQDFITVAINGLSTFVLQWDEPGASAGSGNPGSASDLDFFLVDGGSNIVAAGIDNNKNGDPVEIIQVNGTGIFTLVVGTHKGPTPNEIKIIGLGGAEIDTTLDNFNDGTRFGHTAATGTISVGAVDYVDTPAFGTYPPALETFSSTGFVRISFDAAGNRLAVPIDRFGPLISAVDGGDTSFFGDDSDGNGHPNFFGTSAAAPDAAAVAALMLEANPALAPSDIAALLFDSAIDMDNPYTGPVDFGPDYATGGGLIQADKAVDYAISLVIDNPFAVELDGTQFGDTIVGGGQDNFLFGLGGADVISGGPGADTLIGGTQADRFVYQALWDSLPDTPDFIYDLQNSDKIDLSGIDANETKIADQPFKLVGSFQHKPAQAVLTFHTNGQYAGLTTLELYTNGDNQVDGLILLNGDQSAYNNFIL